MAERPHRPIQTEDSGPITQWVYYILREPGRDDRVFAHCECAETARDREGRGAEVWRWSVNGNREELVS